jgi:2-amino-4-hydroxy-6-hydroxymethyldihydropteridine diphosphokinase
MSGASAATAFIGLGGNVGDVAATFRSALNALAATPGVAAVQASPLYRTPPWGPVPQPAYLNAVARCATTLAADALLEALLAIERDHGRNRDAEQRWGPRTLDLDLLAVGDAVIDSPRLRLPHPRLHERAFVLLPWADLEPEWVIPGQGSVKDCLALLDCSGIEALP